MVPAPLIAEPAFPPLLIDPGQDWGYPLGYSEMQFLNPYRGV